MLEPVNYTPQEILLRKFYYAHGFFVAHDNVKQIARMRPTHAILKDIAQWIITQRATSPSDGHTTNSDASSTGAVERAQRARAATDTAT